MLTSLEAYACCVAIFPFPCYIYLIVSILQTQAMLDTLQELQTKVSKLVYCQSYFNSSSLFISYVGCLHG